MAVKRTSGVALDSPKSARAAGLRYVCDARRRASGDSASRDIFTTSTAQDGASRTNKSCSGSIRWRFRRRGPTSGSVPILTAISGDRPRCLQRRQYRYHPRWRLVRDEVKYGRLVAFAAALPKIRARTRADLAKSGLPREKVLATVVQLLERTLIRVGNEEYARQNGSVGLTTMRDAHAKVNHQNRLPQVLCTSGRDRRVHGRRNDPRRETACTSRGWRDGAQSGRAGGRGTGQRTAAAQNCIRPEHRAPRPG